MSRQAKDTSKSGGSAARSIKQVLEQLVVAFILAFVFRAFFGEAYRIPTGSMAPTLYGTNQFRMCTGCGYEYAYEIVAQKRPDGRTGLKQPKINRCPNCAWEGDKPLPMWVRGRPRLVDGGDRILVMKLGYELADLFPQLRPHLGPKRWDVVVFKNPADPTINFIKRLIGLPGEIVEIVDGDVYVNGKIAPKTAVAQRSLWFIVNDSDYLPKRKGVVDPANLPGWLPANAAAETLWDTSGRVMRFLGHDTPATGTIRYNGRIRDFYAYNDPAEQKAPRMNTVSDVKVEFMLVIREGSGVVEVTLSKREDAFIARIEASGQASLFRTRRRDVVLDTNSGSPQEPLASASIDRVYPKSPVLVAFENVDYRVALRINGQEVLATTAEQYGPDLAELAGASTDPHHPIIRIAAAGQDCQLWHLKVFRDVYYRSPRHSEPSNRMTAEPGQPVVANPLIDKPGHGTAGNPIRLGPHDYYVLGDNSPRSKDSRLWWEIGDHLRQRHEAGEYQLGTVPRDQLVGKAIFVYWPAGHRFFSTGPALIPNMGRMRFIR